MTVEKPLVIWRPHRAVAAVHRDACRRAACDVVDPHVGAFIDFGLRFHRNLLTVVRQARIEIQPPRRGTRDCLHAAVSIDDAFFTSYAADGLIVATPTGSTAYAFSVRGPIVSPRQRAMILTPISAHMLFDRSLVLDESERVRIELIDDRPAVLTVDGRELGVMRRGDAIICAAAPYAARFVTFEPRDFFKIVKTKFGLADR